MKINWYKLNDKAKIPTKRDEDAGFDIYTIEDNVLLMPGEKHLFSTGLAVAAESGYWLMAMDRGSTGSRGLHIHCGVIDNGYRGELFICLCNDNPYPVKFTSQILKPCHAQQDFYFDKDGNATIPFKSLVDNVNLDNICSLVDEDYIQLRFQAIIELPDTSEGGGEEWED